MSADATTDGGSSLQKQPALQAQDGLIQKVQQEMQETASHAWTAFVSYVWLWPIRGLLFCTTHPNIIFSVRYALLNSLITSAVVFTVLAFFAFIPQMAFLAIFTGPLAPIITLIVVGAESIFLISLFARALFLEPALTHVFDATLTACGQTQLMKSEKRAGGSTVHNVRSTLVKPLQVFSQEGMVRYLLTLPLNMIPAVGTVLFLLYNGHNSGPGWHARYFELKGFSKVQRADFVEHRRAEYTAFGMMTLLLNFIPLVGLFFSFTNTAGAALWAAQLEAQENIIDGENRPNRMKAE